MLDVMFERLDYHNGKKDFWQTAVLVISKCLGSA